MDWPILIIGFGVGYTLFFLVVSIGVLRSRKTRKSSYQPMVSVLVACRNEEKDLKRCVDSLLAQNYPENKLEIILIDDQSLDGTADIISGYKQENRIVRGLNTTDSPATHLEAKARAISFGASKAKGDWLYIVDADARVHPDWLSHMFDGVDDQTGLIGGVIMTEESGYFSVSALEKVTLAYTQPITVGLAGWGLPAICSGPNMAIRKSTYDKYGGLESVKFNIAEDLALASIVLNSGQKIRFHGSPETVAHLISVPTLGHLFSQQRRWIRGGFEQGWELWFVLAFVFSYHFLYSWILILGWLISVKATLVALLLKFITDFIFILAEKRKLRIPRLLRFHPLMFLYSLFAFIWIPISLLFFNKVRWKGEGYEVKY